MLPLLSHLGAGIMTRLFLAAIAALLLGVAPARAATETTTRLTFDSSGPIVDSFATVFGGPPGSPSSPAFTIYGGPDITPGSTVVGAVSSSDYILSAYFFLGVTPPSAGTESSRHLVMGANQSLAGQSFAALFPTYDEASLIDAIAGLNAGTVPDFGKEYALVSGFQTQYGPQYAFDLGGTGYLTAFSPGQDFGTIRTSQTTVTVPGSVPEAGTWVMLILGIGLVGALARQRRPLSQASLAPA